MKNVLLILLFAISPVVAILGQNINFDEDLNLENNPLVEISIEDILKEIGEPLSENEIEERNKILERVSICKSNGICVNTSRWENCGQFKAYVHNHNLGNTSWGKLTCTSIPGGGVMLEFPVSLDNSDDTNN